MAKKKTINLTIPEDLLTEFNTVCQQYGHAKQKGQVLSAAILMFLRADPEAQGRCLEDIVGADITAGVAKMIDRAKREQGLRIATREATSQANQQQATPCRNPACQNPVNPQASGDNPPQRQAAKKARDSRHGIRDLPQVTDPCRPDRD